jgi:hypothetical protein
MKLIIISQISENLEYWYNNQVVKGSELLEMKAIDLINLIREEKITLNACADF